jgi:Hydrazine synthase alpha subunit middle domain
MIRHSYNNPQKTFRRLMKTKQLWLLIIVLGLSACFGNSQSTPTPKPPTTSTNPILFVTQVPIAADFATITSTFGNHLASMEAVGRGGDLWIRYTDGSLKNLTKEAGFGVEGFQGANAIAVRDPSVYWDGKKAIFSMIVGATTEQYVFDEFQWQLYEITGLEKNDTPKITKVANQPPYNNVSPIYGTDDRIIFTSDRPRDGQAHLYPQLDEYEEAATVSGLWSLAPGTSDLKLLNHAPSGNFTPILDSYGRVVFTQWDHLKRDQQADADKYLGGENGTFNYSSEAADAQRLDDRTEVFPEPRVEEELVGTNLNAHDFNQFFPWMILEDGSEGETLNHAGRHELMSGDARGYLVPSFTNDPALEEFNTTNPNYIENLFQIKEDPLKPGKYIGVNATEFSTHASGQIVSLDAPPTLPASQMKITPITDKATARGLGDDETPDPAHSGLYRDPLPLSDGTVIAVHTSETRVDVVGDSATDSRYAFRLKTLKKLSNGLWAADAPLTTGIKKDVRFWSPDVEVTYSGDLWELQPVEVKARTRPTRLTVPLPTVEQNVFTQAGVDFNELQDYLEQNSLALAIMRNVTTRDTAEKQQPFNLRVAGSDTQTLSSNFTAGQTIYDVAFMQFFQGDLLRGIGGTANPSAGRRVLAQPMHDVDNPASSGPTGSVTVADDGSVAAFVPANRAMSWQLTDQAGNAVVRERYWLTFQAGEVRVCTSCHGLNEQDQAGQATPTNSPKALLELLQDWKAKN